MKKGISLVLLILAALLYLQYTQPEAPSIIAPSIQHRNQKNLSKSTNSPPIPLAPQSRPMPPKSLKKREKDFKPLYKLQNIVFKEEGRVILDHYHAIAESLYQESFGRKLSRKAGYIVYEGQGLSSAPGLIAINQKNGLWGIVTGRLLIQLTETNDLEGLLSTYQLTLYHWVESIKLATVETRGISKDLFELYQKIKTDSRVYRVRLEIIEKEPQPN